MEKYLQLIASELLISVKQVGNTVSLLQSGATIPFIARYRKEATNNLDETVIAKIRDRFEQLTELDKRRSAILTSIEEQGLLTDDLKKQINQSITLSELEDIYLPYRPKRKTKATMAIAKGLEPLAKAIFLQNDINIEATASKYIDATKEVNTITEALQGARDIIAEWVNENKHARARLRILFEKEAIIYSKLSKGKDEEAQKYKDYFDWQETLSKAPSHRILALFRGENEKFLKITIKPSDVNAIEILEKLFVKLRNSSGQQVKQAIADSYDRLLQPSMETEMRQLYKQKADETAVRIFAENMRQLLLAPPLGQKIVLAIDPGFRTGCKLVCLDRQGKLLHNETIYPHPPSGEVKQAINKIENLVEAYKIEAIAIGNGTAGRETEDLVKRLHFKKDVVAIMVNESGASVYSASAVARQEFPDYDITVRGAVSIGRRLMDPLAELVKIDPKSIGVGQYQHDVNQTYLQKSLEDVVESCVNSVGVDVNTSSKELLKYVSGIGETLAANIIEYRNKNGAFSSRKDLKSVARFGEKAFEQAAGFLRIRNGLNPLDQSAVHPESYHIVNKMAKDLNCEIPDLIKDENLRKQINIQQYVTKEAGIPTLTDIMQELAKPGRDPREKFDFFEFDKNIRSIHDLIPGMIVPGIVTNITAFGAFVDIGVHQDGLVHVSQMAAKYIKDPNEIVKMYQKVQVKVLEVDKDRKRIQLSMII